MRYGERTRTGESLSGFGRRPVLPPLIVDYLVVAGGGGGARPRPAGGAPGVPRDRGAATPGDAAQRICGQAQSPAPRAAA